MSERTREPDATVIITTRDRRERLRHALRSALAQTAEIEIVVLDDASRDGTAEMVRAEFPGVRLERWEASIGCPAARNRGFDLARAGIVVCLDDDASFTSPDTVAQVLAEFDDPRVGVVTIPYVNVRREDSLRQLAPDDGRWATGTFAGGASALRRDVFLGAGGYADFDQHGEETDLAVRLLDRGFLVRLGRAGHVVHDEASPKKTAASYTSSSRNHLLAVWRNVPWPYLPGRLLVVAAKVLGVGVADGEARAALHGVVAAARACASGRVARAPVRRRTHVLSRRLHRRGPLPLDEAISALRGAPAGHAPKDAATPLRILSILTTHAAGGAEFAAVDMLRALGERGARVRLLTNRVDLVAGTGVDAGHIDLGPKLRGQTRVSTALRAPLTLAQLVLALRREAPFDVLLLHYKKEQLLGALLPRSRARSVVWAEWGPLPAQMRRGVARRAYAWAARRAQAIVAESAATARSIAAAGVPEEQIVVVPNVLDAGEVAPDPVAGAELRRQWGVEDAFVLGCMTRLDKAKRLDVVIDALEHLDEQVVLVIAGDGEDADEFRRRAARFGGRVIFVAGARGRVAQFLSACDVQVYAPGPSEGAARAITLGQLAGRPVIATAPQGAQELVVAGTGSIVAPAHDPVALARCVESYRADARRVAEEGAAARALALRRIRDADGLGLLERTLLAAARRATETSRRTAPLPWAGR